jgi:hypothetical protein
MILAIFLMLVMSGCTGFALRGARAGAALDVKGREDVQAARYAAEATVSRAELAAAAIKVGATNEAGTAMEQTVRAAGVSAAMSGSAERILGPPAIDQRQRVERLCSTNEAVVVAARASEAERNAQVSAILVERDRLQAQLLEMGAKYEAERNTSIVRRFWRWCIGTSGLTAIILICVFFPAAMPVFGRIIGWVVGRLPTLAHYVGLVGVEAYKRAVTTVQEVKLACLASGDAGRLAEVKKIAVENCGDDSDLVKATKRALGYKKVETGYVAS